MKKYLTIKAFLTLLLGLLIVFGGCNKDKLVGEYYLSDEMKRTVPFDGSETITFIDGEDTILFNSGRRITYTKTTYITDNKYVIEENDETSYMSLNKKYVIFISLIRNYTNSCKMKVGWKEYNGDITINEGVVVFNIPFSTTSLQSGQWVIDELTIQGVKYHNIFADSTSFHGYEQGPNDPTTFYYTEEAGIIKIDFSDSTSWELDHIEW